MLLGLPLAGGGCQSAQLAAAYTQADDFKAFVGVGHAQPVDTLYRVAAPDTLHITVLRGGEAVDHRVTLPPDGRLLMPGLAWPVDTTGMTPGEVAQDLEQAILAADAQSSETPDAPDAPDASHAPDAVDDAGAPLLATGPMANRGLTLDPAFIHDLARQRLEGRDPVYVAVRVDRFASRRIFVFGQVQDSGSQAWTGENRLSTALAAAVPGPRADLDRVLVLRPGPDGDPRRRLVVSAQSLLHTGDNTLDVALNPGDIVFVPATGLGRLGLAIDRVRPRARIARTGTRPAPFFPALAPSRIVVADTDTATQLSVADETSPADAPRVVTQASSPSAANTPTAQVSPADADPLTPPETTAVAPTQVTAAPPVNTPGTGAAGEPSAQALMQIRSDIAPLSLAQDPAALTDTEDDTEHDTEHAPRQAQVLFWAP